MQWTVQPDWTYVADLRQASDTMAEGIEQWLAIPMYIAWRYQPGKATEYWIEPVRMWE